MIVRAARLYHAALPHEWTAAERAGTYENSTRGRTLADEGFIHASYAHQVEGVVNRFYADLAELVLLVVDRGALTVPVIDEPATDTSADECFPHIYGPLPVAAVVEARPWRRAPGTPWRLPTSATNQNPD